MREIFWGGMSETSLEPLIDTWALHRNMGDRTRFALEEYAMVRATDVTSAVNDLSAEIIPFNERLCDYVAAHFGVDNDHNSVRKELRRESEAKGLDLSSSNLSQWLTSCKGEVNLSAKSIFKLCLAMELSLDQSAYFIYDCLYQNWFNYRSKDQAIFLFFLGTQDFFGNQTYAAYLEFVKFLKESPVIADDNLPCKDVTGYTKTIGSGIRRLLETDYVSKQAAFDALRDFLEVNTSAFTGVQRSAIRTYNTYLKQGGVGIRSLMDLYYEQTGLTLPESSYLDMADTTENLKRKRLLWGTFNRQAWIAEFGSDWDILNTQEIRLERHAVERMTTSGVLRGNILALLFFHFCLEHKVEFQDDKQRRSLLERFYRMTNMTLLDECGMLPLHPRKQFDRLFLLSIANCGKKDPIDYLNQVLERFYRF
jgi:hypothetical protein